MGPFRQVTPSVARSSRIVVSGGSMHGLELLICKRLSYRAGLPDVLFKTRPAIPLDLQHNRIIRIFPRLAGGQSGLWLTRAW